MSSLSGRLIVATLLIATLSGCDSSGNNAATVNQMCDQSAEAAHYIAAKSGSASNVVRVTGEVIADRKYPILGDKVLASIGAVVATSIGRQTPDEISARIRSKCEGSR